MLILIQFLSHKYQKRNSLHKNSGSEATALALEVLLLTRVVSVGELASILFMMSLIPVMEV